MSMINLEPDIADISELLAPTLKRCPFCGHWPLTFSRVNEEHTHYQAHVQCSGCKAGIFVNAHTLEEARATVRARWERRHEPAPGGSA